jgi:hypothetical protein
MATCPRCKGHLTDNHRCPPRRLKAAIEICASALVGGFIGLFLVALFDPKNAGVEDILIIAGALTAVGINRALRG